MGFGLGVIGGYQFLYGWTIKRNPTNLKLIFNPAFIVPKKTGPKKNLFMAFQKNQCGRQTWIQRAKTISKNPPSSVVLLAISVTVIADFVAHVFTPLGIAAWVLYFIPLLLSVYVNRRFFSCLLAAVFSMLIFAGFYLSTPNFESHDAFVSCCIGICVLWLVAVFLDERKQVETTLRASEERCRLLLELHAEAIFKFAADGTITYVNPVCCQFFGKTERELLGSKWYQSVVKEDLPMIQERLQRMSPSNPIAVVENRICNRAGEVRWVQFVNHAFFDAAGFLVETQSSGRDITDRKQWAEVFKNMEERYGSLAESSPDAIFILDRASTIQYVNRAGAQWLGRPVAELLGRSNTEFFPPDDAQRHHESIRRVFETAESLQIERSQSFVGGEKWIETRLVPLRDKKGKVFLVMGISRDLTERKRAETVLRESEARLRLLVEQVPAIIWAVDRDLKITSSTGLPLSALNLKNNEAVGLSLFQFFGTTDEKIPILAAHRRALCGERNDLESEWGGRAWRSLFEPMVDAGGDVIGCIAVAVDVTEAKKAEARLNELAAIVQNSEDAIISITPEGNVISWNKGAELLLGYTAGEMIGKTVSVIFPPEQFEEAGQIIRKVMQAESVESYETLRCHKNGKLRQVSVKVSAVTDAAGKITGMAAIYRDITARKQLEKTVLEISADERRRIGHELHDGLGQYLAGIAFKTKALEDNLAADSSRFARHAEKIVGLINDAIQQTRKLARGFDPVDFEVNGLPAALQNLAAQTEDLFHIECAFHCNEERLTLDTQTNVTLYRIAQEAISNAIKHGRARRIEIDLAAGKPQLSLTIRDNGKGFLPDEKNRSGMGLRIMGYRADNVGGVLSVHSEIDAGTQIKCLLPAGLS